MKDTLKLQFALDRGGRRVKDGFAIYPAAKIFQAGDHKDRHGRTFSMTPEEMKSVVEGFKPVGGNIEHTSFLSGRALQVNEVYINEDEPDTLRGEVSVPLWLDTNLGDHERKLSAEFDLKSKGLTGLALCVNPIIPDAALASFAVAAGAMTEEEVAEFAKDDGHRTRSGQRVMQDVHDSVARYGAICQPNAKLSEDEAEKQRERQASFASKTEATAVQKIHDLCTTCGAKCEDLSATSSYYPYFSAEEQADMTPLQQAAVVFALSGDTTDLARLSELLPKEKPAAPGQPKKEQKMEKKPETKSLWDRFVAFATGKGATKGEDGKIKFPQGAEFSEADIDLAVAVQESEETKTDPELAKIKAELAESRRETVEAKAIAFADKAITEKRALPAERDILIAQFTSAANDDYNHPTKVVFSQGDKEIEGSRVDQLKAAVFARPTHKLVNEEVADEVVILSHNTKPEKKEEGMSKEREEQLLKSTSLGAAVVKKSSAKS